MSNEVDIALMKKQIQDLQADNAKLHEELQTLKHLDEKRMRAAVVTLGAAVIGMGLYIWKILVEKNVS